MNQTPQNSLDESSIYLIYEKAVDSDLTYTKWTTFPIGSNFPLWTCLAGTIGSFLFGYNICLLNSSIVVIASELWPCDPYGDPDQWSAMEISDECLAFMTTNYDTDIVSACSEPSDCGGCIIPTATSCDMSIWMNALLTTMILIGAFIACFFTPRLLNFSMRATNCISMVTFSIATISSICAGSIASMCFARMLSGFGVGITSILSPLYISEMSPTYRKGTFGTAHEFVITVGILVGIFLSLPFGAAPLPDYMYMTTGIEGPEIITTLSVPLFDKIWWRALMGFNFVPIFINYIAFSYLSMNSPREYIQAQEHGDAVQGLLRIYRSSDFGEIQNYYQDIALAIESTKKSKDSGMSFCTAMTIRKYRKVILIGCSISAIQQCSGINVFASASNQIFAQAGTDPSFLTLLSVIMAIINVVMTIPVFWLIESTGRKPMMVLGIAGQSVSMFVPCISLWISPTSSVSQILSIVGIMSLITFYSLGIGPVLWVWFTEIFPADVNHVASSALLATNWMAGIIMVFVGTVITNNKTLFTIFTMVNIGCLLFVLVFCKETKGYSVGKSPYLIDLE